jgi:exodeoxyribonuclease-3
VKVATWNVNSLKVRLPQVLAWVAEAEPDVLALQEIKQPDEDFPAEALQAAGYHGISNGQRTYNGVALLSRQPPADPVRALPGSEDPQRRVLAATIAGVRIVNLYVPNGQSVDSDKYGYKLEWLRRLRDYLAHELETHEKLVVLGDFNIAPGDRDVHDPELWRGRVLFSEPEHEALARLLELGLVDLFRQFDQPEDAFSWWDYRAAAFRRNRGLRIDLILGSHAMAERCIASAVDPEPRGWERPSDHAPVWAEFEE